MARLVLTNPVLTINGVNLSAHANQIVFTPSRASLNDAAFGDEFAKTRPGLKNYTVSVQFYQDFAAAAVHATLWPLYFSGLDAVMTFKASNSTTSATNPLFSGTVWVQDYPLGGNHGETQMANVTFGIRGDFSQLTSG